MPRGKSKKKSEPEPVEVEEPEEADSCQSDAEVDTEWAKKYTGENQMTWFRTIIRAQATDVMKDIIASEVQKLMKDALADTKRQVNEFQSKISQLEEQNTKLKASIDIEELRSENKKLRRNVEKLQFQLHQKDVKLKELVVKLDCIEQKDYRNEVQMVGLDESTSEEEDMKKVIKVAKEKMGVKLKRADVKGVTRLGRKSSEKITPRDLVVTFKDNTTREVFYDNRKKLVVSKAPQHNIYVNDRLTNYRKSLFYEARKLYKGRRLYAVWTQKGNVLVRRTEDGPVKQINKFEDLKTWKETETSSSFNSSSSVEISSHLSDYDIYVDSDV